MTNKQTNDQTIEPERSKIFIFIKFMICGKRWKRWSFVGNVMKAFMTNDKLGKVCKCIKRNKRIDIK